MRFEFGPAYFKVEVQHFIYHATNALPDDELNGDKFTDVEFIMFNDHDDFTG